MGILCTALLSALLLLSLSGCHLFYTASTEAPPAPLPDFPAVGPAPAPEEPAPPQETPEVSPESPPTEETPEPEPLPIPEPEPDPSPAPTPLTELDPADFVRVQDYLPDIQVELRYATDNNFTAQVIYEFSDTYLRCGTVQKLAEAQALLAEQGYSLLIWDGFRPTSAQFKLWAACPDPVYVANPETGFSSHSRGNTVDVTLVTAEGEPVEMPTDYDDFSTLADRDYSDVPETAAQNALLLEAVMTGCGFKPYSGEWWHFSDADSYPVEESFIPPPNAE